MYLRTVLNQIRAVVPVSIDTSVLPDDDDVGGGFR